MNKIRDNKTLKLVILIALVVACAAMLAFGTYSVVNAAGDDNMPSEPESSMMTLRSGNAESGSVVLNATVSPAGTEESLTWSVSWADPNFTTWNVNDYIRLTPNGGSCTVELVAPFEKQIVVTAASAVDPTVKASCTVDYLQKLLGQTLQVNPNSDNCVGDHNVAADGTLIARPLTYSSNYISVYSEKIMFATLLDEVYTIPSEIVSATARIYVTDEFKNVVDSYLSCPSNGGNHAVPIKDLTWADLFNKCGVDITVPTSTSQNLNVEDWNKWNEALIELGDHAALRIEVTVETDYQSEVFNYYVKFDTSNVLPYILEVNLDQSNIIF